MDSEAQTSALPPKPLTPQRVQQLTQELRIYHRNAVGQYPVTNPSHRAGRDSYMRAALGASLVMLVGELAGGACTRGQRPCNCGRGAPAQGYDEPDDLPAIALHDLDRLEADTKAYKRLVAIVYATLALGLLSAVLS